MEEATSPFSRAMDRRGLVKTGAAAAAGLWVAPSVLTLDRAAAAIGSCGVKPRQVDFSRWSGSLLPSNFTSDDSSVAITFAQFDPFGVQDSFWASRVFNGTINARDNPVITAMSNAANGDRVRLRFDFSTPVALSFHLVDIDRQDGSWEDTVIVRGRVGGGPWMAPSSMVTGGAQTQISPNTVRGDYATTGPDGNVEVDFQTPIDRLVIVHRDDSTFTGFQWIGVHDFHWC